MSHHETPVLSIDAQAALFGPKWDVITMAMGRALKYATEMYGEEAYAADRALFQAKVKPMQDGVDGLRGKFKSAHKLKPKQRDVFIAEYVKKMPQHCDDLYAATLGLTEELSGVLGFNDEKYDDVAQLLNDLRGLEAKDEPTRQASMDRIRGYAFNFGALKKG